MEITTENLLQGIVELLSIGNECPSWESPDFPARFVQIAERLIPASGVILHIQTDPATPPKLAVYSGFSRDQIDSLHENVLSRIRAARSFPLEFNLQENQFICMPFFRSQYLEGALTLARNSTNATAFSAFELQLIRYLSIIASGVFHAATTIHALRTDLQSREYLLRRLYILYETSNALVRTQTLDVRLHVILTATTLGEGLGFNRALLYLLDPDGFLVGRMGVGPLDGSEAHTTWNRLIRSHTPGYEILREIVRTERVPNDALHHQTTKHRIRPDDTGILVQTIREHRAFLIDHDAPTANVSASDRDILNSDSFATVPLILAEKPIGLIVVDNHFNQKRISPEDLQFLWMISNLASASIDSSNNFERIVKLNKEIRHTREALVAAEKASAVGELALHLAHEIRNPLVAAGGFAGRLAKILPQDSPEQQYADIIRKETLRIEKILADVLKTTKIPHSHVSQCDVHVIVREVIELLKFSMEERGIVATFDFKPRIALVAADPVLLKQAIHNIVSNSIQAQPSGGSVHFYSTVEDERVCLKISDSGPGVDPKQLNDLFKPFYTTKSDGTGLGLFLTKRIIESFHAQIRPCILDSGGLSFSLTFPISSHGGDETHENSNDHRR